MRYVILLFVLLSWAWLVVYGGSAPPEPQRVGPDQARAQLVADGEVDGLEAELAGWPRDRARRLYDRIVDEVRRGDCQAAIPGFEMFFVLHADSPLVPYAQYMLGECAFRLERYEAAVEAFDRVVSHSPLSPKLAAAAFMKKGLVYAKLGQPSRSRHLLELVVVQFPHTRQAAEARQALLVH